MSLKGLLSSYKNVNRDEKPKRQRVEYKEEAKQERVFSPPSRVVDFLIIGVQKGGTMAAVANLNKHPDIYVKSECQFFTFCWDFGVNWYRNKLQTNKSIVGEKTPEYIYCDDCLPRIKMVCPSAKFLLFLRDPIKRAYSAWNMEIKNSMESLTFEECISRELEAHMNEKRTYGNAEFHYIQRGFYMDQIERFQKHFPDRDQMLIFISEHVRKNPQEAYDRIFDFLGARRVDIEAEDEHIGTYTSKISKVAVKKLQAIYKPHNERLFEFLGYRIPEWEYDVEENDETKSDEI